MPSDERDPDPLGSPAPPAPMPETAERAGGLRVFLRSYWTPAGRQALRNLIGLVLCTGISQATSAGILLILANGLSQAGFAAVILAVNVQLYLVALGMSGLPTIIVRDLTRQPDRADELTTAYLLIVGVSSTAVGALTAVAAALLPVTWDERVMLWCVAAANTASCLNLNPLFDAAHRQARAAALSLPGDLLAVGVIGGLYAAGALTVPAVAVVLVGKYSLTTGVQAAVFGYSVRRFRWVWGNTPARRMIRSGWPLLLAILFSMVPFQGGVLVVRLTRGTEDTAVYGLALQVAAVYLMVAWLVVRVLQPHINGPYGQDRTFVKKLVLFGVLTFGGLWAAAVAAGWFVTRYLLPAAYHDSFGPMVLLLTAAVGAAVGMVMNCYFLRFGRERVILWLQGGSGLVYLAAAVASHQAPLGVFAGASVAATATLAASAVAVAIRTRDRAGVDTRDD